MVKQQTFRPFKALVIGDFMLDTYTTGRVRRISPEAPVQVLEVFKEESRPGGAGNAALNLIALGGSVSVIGRVGDDGEGGELKAALEKEGADARGLLIEKGYRTPIKNRLIADSQQLLRVDFETIQGIDAIVEREAIVLLGELIPKVEVVAISDYGKGFLSSRLIQEAIRIARRENVPSIVDPKGTDFAKYSGATVLKPNLSETYAAAKMGREASLDVVAKEIMRISEVEQLLITRSEAGMSLFNRMGERSDFPVRSREVKDVTGAGDTVLAMISLGLANQLELSLAVQMANIAAGIAIEKIGCATVRLGEVAMRLLETDRHTKIFDESHAYALQQVLMDRRYVLLVLNQEEPITGNLLRTIHELSRGRELVLYLQEGEGEFVQFLSSLDGVLAIILQKEKLRQLCEAIHPDEVFFLEKKELRKAKDLLSHLLLETRSTTVS
jgi:D-beta-D-heptose 7-phosphate kinase/D-beta-D-heptose 1-phosphate adenosyltransferase